MVILIILLCSSHYLLSQPTMATTIKKWTQECMNAAYEACMSGMSIYRASIKFNIPRMTLSNRVLNKVPLASMKGHPMHLTQERRYPLNFTFMADRGFPISIEVICYAWCIDGKHPENERYFGDKRPSLMWLRGFKKRNPDLRLKSSESVMKQTVANARKDILSQYF